MKRHGLDLWLQAIEFARQHGLAARRGVQDASRVEDAAADAALRYIVRAEVAGATPPLDTLARLQRRITQDARQSAPAAPRAVRARIARLGSLPALLRPYVSQAGMAMLLLLAMLGTLLPAAQWAQLGATPTVVPVVVTDSPTRPVARVNRALQILDAGSPAGVAPALAPAGPPDALAGVTAYKGHAPDGSLTVPVTSSDPQEQQGAAGTRQGGPPSPSYIREMGVQPW